MARRHYSDRERAAALAVYDANAGNLTRTAREAGVPASTLERWVKGRDMAAPPDLRSQKRADLADVFGDIVYRALGLAGDALAHLEAMPDAERGKAALERLADLNRLAGTGVDKRQLLRGEPTSRVETRDAPEVERRAARILTMMAPESGAGGKRKRA